MRSGRSSVPRNCRGQAILELALIMPPLILLIMVLFDLSRAIHARNIVINMSREGANLVLRSPWSQESQKIMDTLAFTAQPLDMRANGMMYVTLVKGVAGVGNQIQSQTAWQGGGTTTVSRLGTPTLSNPNPVAKDMRLTLADGETAQVVEIMYNYKSLFKVAFIGQDHQLYSTTVF